MKALILAGGDLYQSPFVKRIVKEATFIVAADSGLHHAKTLNIKPDLIVGDFDSVDNAVLQEYQDVPQERFSIHKNLLDVEIALQAARKQGATSFAILGATGSRLDQSLATLFIAANLKREGVEVSIHGKQDVFFLADQTQAFDLPNQQLFSLLSLETASTVSLENALYPLQHERLEFGLGLGVSNRVKQSPLTVTVLQGLVAVILERPTLKIKAKEKIWGEKAKAIEQGLQDLDPDLAKLIIEVAYDNVFERPDLDLKTKELLAIAHLIHLGSESEIKTHIYGALNCGANLEDIKETILHAAMFIGFPKAMFAMKILKSITV
jgi:thiamine pyrophosphokinase